MQLIVNTETPSSALERVGGRIRLECDDVRRRSAVVSAAADDPTDRKRDTRKRSGHGKDSRTQPIPTTRSASDLFLSEWDRPNR